MNKEIQKAFLEGINEVYSTLFTDGKQDGVKLYLLDSSTKGGIYRESKVKRYKRPVLLVCKAQLNPSKTDESVESEIKTHPKFTVPTQSLLDNGIECQKECDLDTLKRGYMEFHNSFYEIKNVTPNTFLADTFMTLLFECEYRKDVKEILVVEDNLSEEGDLDVSETTNDR